MRTLLVRVMHKLRQFGYSNLEAEVRALKMIKKFNTRKKIK